ncbi:DUF4360 domain-containing protein [Lentzea aerocolonigenes]|uniref:DUF4360 domain-containing protein n=1 Tax=Lentzea aerocolonigenes TaxID=68170 RepID=UPI0004C368CE|nr:DUF4360 domain-containing protein [Lentzea aerocolonigenes]MCP2244988.1 protein of unknown function (DUF4360) [Lentzea aerocolonigenes]
MLSVMAATSLAVSLLVAPEAPSTADVVPPGKITVDVVTVNGSGCPAGTAAVAVADDNTAFTVTYSDYTAQAGSGSSPTDFRKNCQLNLRVHYPQGFTFGIAKADYRGFAHLPRGAKGMQRASYYFSGSSSTGTSTHNINAPITDNWQFTDSTDVAEIVFAPCGMVRNLNVNTEVRAFTNSSNQPAFVSMDSTDGSVNTRYQFAWKRC